MVINETYVKDDLIARMSFVQPSTRRGDGTLITETLSYADIFTTSDSQIQVKCTKEEYIEVLKQLASINGA